MLLLPFDSPDFAAPAEAVAHGCRAALSASDRPLALEIARTDGTGSGIVTVYEAALRRGAAAVVGPLTRNGVTALVRRIRPGAPTLLLNTPEGEGLLPLGYYTFGLSVEHEARLVARTAMAPGLRNAVVVQANTQLARRIGRTFADEWAALGGRIVEVVEFDSAAAGELLAAHMKRVNAGLIFLSGNAHDARVARPFLPRDVPIHAVSLVHAAASGPLGNTDLEGIRFLEMPWFVQPDHPAVMVYERRPDLAGNLQRFYALGIDACRLAPLLARHEEAIDLDGVTGHIRMRAGGFLERRPVAAVFRNGSAVPEVVR